MKTSFSTRITRHTVTRADRAAAAAVSYATEARKVADALGDDDSLKLACAAEGHRDRALDKAALVRDTLRGDRAITVATSACHAATFAKQCLTYLRQRYQRAFGGLSVEVAS